MSEWTAAEKVPELLAFFTEAAAAAATAVTAATATPCSQTSSGGDSRFVLLDLGFVCAC